MAEQLGQIDRPSVERFRSGRNLLLVPLVYNFLDDEEEGQEKLDKYWSQMQDQVAGFESRLGSVKHIYHELVTQSGEEGIVRLEAVNGRSHAFVKARCELGATLQSTEDEDTLREFADLQQCLMFPLTSESVYGRLREWLNEASRKRYDHIAKQIGETLGAAEVGLLLISEGHQVQFPEGVEVFYVSPPALDELHRWLRDRMEARRREAAVEEKE